VRSSSLRVCQKFADNFMGGLARYLSISVDISLSNSVEQGLELEDIEIVEEEEEEEEAIVRHKEEKCERFFFVL